MNWTTEVPKESGWYWVKINTVPEIVYLDPCLYLVWCNAYNEPYSIQKCYCWGDKLEIPE